MDVVHCIIVLHSPPMLSFLVCVRIIVRRVDDGTNDNLLVSGGNQNIDNEPPSTQYTKRILCLSDVGTNYKIQFQSRASHVFSAAKQQVMC